MKRTICVGVVLVAFEAMSGVTTNKDVKQILESYFHICSEMFYDVSPHLKILLSLKTFIPWPQRGHVNYCSSSSVVGNTSKWQSLQRRYPFVEFCSLLSNSCLHFLSTLLNFPPKHSLPKCV